MLLALVGCSGSNPGSTTSGPIEDEHIASSLTEFFQKSLDAVSTSPGEREMIERAITTGQIDAADYEVAHVYFADCMAQHGFDLSFRQTAEGIYIELPLFLDDMSGEPSAREECTRAYALLEYLYRVQQANPDLLMDQRLVAVQCLKNRGFVDDGYTVEDLDQNLAEFSFPFDVFDDGPNDCLQTAGWAFFKGQDKSGVPESPDDRSGVPEDSDDVETTEE
jgi:hypothetical protein